jgi:hypothetical protein
MNLSRRIKALAIEPPTPDPESRKAAIKLAAELCAARARIAQLEAETNGQRQAIAALHRQDHLAEDLIAVRAAEREACARAVENLGFCIGAKAIRERP